MKNLVIVDTGPLVALLNRADSAHAWVVRTLQEIAPPLMTCEAVLAEATYLTRNLPGARVALIEMIGEGFCPIGMAPASGMFILSPPRQLPSSRELRDS